MDTTVTPRSERPPPGGVSARSRSIAVGVALLVLSVPVASGIASAQAQPNDPSEPAGSVAPDEPTDTTRPEDPTTTEPDEPTDTTEPDEPADGTVPEESTDTGDPAEPGEDDRAADDDPADALTWAAVGLTLLLLGVVVGWMLRRPSRPSGPRSDDDWPGQGEVL